MKNTLKIRKEESEFIGDIYTGNIYKIHVKNGRLGNINQLSYSLCTDGVRLAIYYLYISNLNVRKFHKSSVSLWPIWVVCNELEPGKILLL